MKHAPITLLAALCILGAALLPGCNSAGATVLGKDPGTSAATAVRDLKPAARATVTGTMVEKCPTAGCWFMLKDGSGIIRVDTKAAGFTVTDVAVNTQVTVSGEVKNGTERTLSATGLRY